MSIKASALVKMLQDAISKFGDLPILGGKLDEETPVSEIVALDDDGGDAETSREKPVGFFLES